MAQSGFSQFYRRLSSRLLSLAVKPHLISKEPEEQSHTDSETAANSDTPHYRCYILPNYSRSNALLVDSETRRLDMSPALDPIPCPELDESSSVIFLEQRNPSVLANCDDSTYSPRLERLIQFVQKNPEVEIELIPVSILWGRAPDKEDSLFKLLFTDTWSPPGALKQLINIGVHGRQTYLQFHSAISLRQILKQASTEFPELKPEAYVSNHLTTILERQREIVLGPDLSDRHHIIYDILESQDIREAIQSDSKEHNISIQQARHKAFGYLNEITADYSYSAVRFADISLTRLWTQLYDGVEVHNFNRVRELAETHELIYTPSHRSHIDYLLLSYVIFKRGLMIPYIAAGDNLNLPVIGQILRGGGAFFIKRSFRGNKLYSSVIKEYLHSIQLRNTPLEYFIEGGRSRSGRLLSPKMGMLSMTIHAYLRKKNKPIAFIPTYIGYERLTEGSTYVGEMEGRPKEAESILGILGSLRKIERIFGKVHVNFGEPVLLDRVLKDNNADQIKLTRNIDELPAEASQSVSDTAIQIMENINRAAVINPVSLLSLTLLATPKHTLDEQVFIAQLDLYRHINQQFNYDDSVQTTLLSGNEIINYGLKLKLIKRIPHILGDMIAIESQQAVLLTYFRNNILHLFILPSLIASLVEHNGKISVEDLSNVVRGLYPFLKAELFLKWSIDELDDVIEKYIDVLLDNHLLLDDGRRHLYSPTPNSEQHRQLLVLAAPVKQSLERYYLTLALINQRGSGSVTTRQIEELSHIIGQRMSVLFQFNSPEFFDKALFQNFLKVLQQLELIELDEEGLITFDDRLSNIAQDARLVLDEDTLNTLQHVTFFSNEELDTALEQLTKQKKSRLKRKK